MASCWCTRRNPRWVDDPKGALYIAAYQDKLSNIWYYSSRIFPLFVANYYRHMLRLPKIGSVLIPMDNKKVRGVVFLCTYYHGHGCTSALPTTWSSVDASPTFPHSTTRIPLPPDLFTISALDCPPVSWCPACLQVTKKWHMGAMNITLDDPLHTPVYYNRMNPFNNFAPVDGRPWCVRRVVITGAQVRAPSCPPLS